MVQSKLAALLAMKLKTAGLLASASALCGGAISGQQGLTPSSGTRLLTLQEAIDAAADGEILYADHYGPFLKHFIRVDRPLTLVGGRYHHVEFAGSGHGRALLVGAQVLADPNPPNGHARPGIAVSGFDLVSIVGSSIRASGYAHYGQPMGASAVVVHDYQTALSLVESDFHATIGGTVPEYTCAAPYGGSSAVVSPGAVSALTCAFFGGGSIGNFWDYDLCPTGPLYTAAGASALTADFLLHADCTFMGGPGAFWWNHPAVGEYGPAVECGTVRPLPAAGSWPIRHR